METFPPLFTLNCALLDNTHANAIEMNNSFFMFCLFG